MNGIDLDAPVISRRSLTIAAPLRTVWNLHAAHTSWPVWHPGIDKVLGTEPALAPGMTLHWLTQGSDIVSTVHEVVPGQRTLWSGTSFGTTGIHAWIFTPVDGGVLAQSHESWSGERVLADVAAAQRDLDAALDTWLGHLKATAEAA
ncbi:SRPBCC family protein [Nocardiopsis sp. CC223A]|uniref:SRPBCC family protein n=1 Tax=Nocardiopsis sp. CC223A TaxID=3044051 RepID=UPI00278C7C11|nr:SRPBCC family protein [Nocardiopsis sp. CC223A]